MPSNTLQPNYLELINSILTICYVHLDVLAGIIKERPLEFSPTHDFVRLALFVQEVINHRAENIFEKKVKFMNSGEVDTITRLTIESFKNPSTENKIPTRNTFAFTFIEGHIIFNKVEMICYSKRLEGLVESDKLPIPQPQAKSLLKEIKKYLEHAFEHDQSPYYSQKSEQSIEQEYLSVIRPEHEQEYFLHELKDSFKDQPQDPLEDPSQDYSKEFEDDKQSEEDYLIEQQMLQKIQLAKDYKQKHLQIIQKQEQEKQRLEKKIKRVEQSSKDQLKQAYQEYEQKLHNLIKDHKQQQKLQEVFAVVTSQDFNLRETSKKNKDGSLPIHLEAKEIDPPSLKLSYSVFDCDNNGGEDAPGMFTDNSYQYLGEFVVSSTSDCGRNCGRACDGCLAKAINISKEQPDTVNPLPQTTTPPVHDRKPWRKRDVMKSVWQKSILPFKRNKEPDNRKTRKRDLPKRLWERIKKKTNNQ